MESKSITSPNNGKTDSTAAAATAIAEYIIMDLHPLEVVEGQGFQSLLKRWRPSCEILSKNKLEEEIIPKIYDTCRKSVATTLSCISREVGLTIEEWRSNYNERFVTVSVYYQNSGKPVLEYKVLSTIHAPLDWEESQWGNTIDSLLLDWNLKLEGITAVVVASSRTKLLTALRNRGLRLVPCLPQMLTKLIQEEFEDNTNIIREEKPSNTENYMSEMELSLGGLCLTESGIPSRDYCPLQWWAKNFTKCPNLGRLACRYNCVPACCSSPSRISAEVLYGTRRAALPLHLTDKLLFLHSNYTV